MLLIIEDWALKASISSWTQRDCNQKNIIRSMAPSLRHLWRPIDSVLGKADHSEAAAGIPPWAWGEQLSLGNCIPLSVSLLINDKGGSLVVVGVPKTVFCKPFDLKNHYKGSWVERAVSLAMGRRMSL